MTDQPRYDDNDRLDTQHAERKRRESLCRGMSASSTLLLIIYAIKDAVTGETMIAAIVSAYVVTNLIAMALYEKFKNLDVFTYYLAIAASSLLLILLFTGGSGNSGIVWLPAWPILIYSILPVKTATFVSLGLYSFIIVCLLGPSPPFVVAEYSAHVEYAGIGSALLVGLFTFTQARTREQSLESIGKLNSELRQIASTDSLTHLANRRDMSLRLEFECKRAQRAEDEFSIIICDIDYFKKINDSFGHSVGDQALQAFSALLESRFRETDKVGRWGGEEFLVILPHTDLREATKTANTVRLEVCQTSLIRHIPNRLVTMSAGVASSSESTEPGNLLKIADNRLYKAKNSGRNRVMPQQ